MKKIAFFLTLSVSGTAAFAQSAAPDQNPRWRESMEKYIAEKSQHSAAMNTTVQDTYKAYDWSTARAERKADRLNFRRERNYYENFGGYNRYNYSRYNNYYNNGWDNGYYQPYYSPYQNRGRYRFHW